MKFYIELVFILALMLIFIIWRIWFDWSKKRILKEFKKNPEIDSSRKIQNGNNQKGGVFGSTEQGTGIGTTEPKVEPTPSSSIGPEQLEGSELLQTTDVNDVRENSPVPGKDRSNVRRRFFRRRKEK